MLYPKDYLSKLGKVLMQIDFIGPRYLTGSNDPIHFLSCKYVRPKKKHIFFRIKSQTTTEVLNVFYTLFFILNLPLPDIVQMDNDASFRGCIERAGCIGRVIRWLCCSGIIPVFNAQSSPWNNGSVEGGNSVFDRKFWKKFHFSSLKEVDQKLEEFNKAYDAYLIFDYQSIIKEKKDKLIDPKKIKSKHMKGSIQPNLYLLRVVKERYDKCSVEALNRYIRLPDKYKGQYVLIKINLKKQYMQIFQKIEGKKNILYAGSFAVFL